ncbi:hypothetical protein [Glycomyces buryatensis]|uniref:Uncharacterized protein n=1 Tax=Glycomyces buryatensis TaxID=2570927 RepID=A0A4V4HSJ5_9ACTN|nr:hypothetical protein [Glycomyces buryatensis]THV41936.1 hypothetical protein FAB82_09475 [Glycomyces buryatensis]
MTSSIKGLICPECGIAQLVPSRQDFVGYFESRDWGCVNCAYKVDLWGLLLRWVRNENPLIPGILALGIGRQLIISKQMHPNTDLQVLFEDHGVPEGATILDVVLTPVGLSATGPNLWPALRTQRLHLNHVAHHLSIHPVELKELQGFDSNDPNINQLNILVIWMPPPSEPEEEPFFSAAKAFTIGDFRGSIIPAQIAVELKINRILSEHYGRFGSKRDVASFLTNGATYGHQLRFLIPSLLKLVGAPQMPEKVEIGLRSLQSCRNKVGHQHLKVSRDEAAEMILAAKFGYEYLNIYGPLLTSE